MTRLDRFRLVGAKESQEKSFDTIRAQYPEGTRFVVLPMAMDNAAIGFGDAEKNVEAQHEALAELAAKYPDQLLPFATCHPEDEASVKTAQDCLKNKGFKGLKLYPKLGYYPDHSVLLEDIYPLPQKPDGSWRPVLSHCSRGGLYQKGLSKAERD